MKKFFTLFAAALMVLSASAAPVKVSKSDVAKASKRTAIELKQKPAISLSKSLPVANLAAKNGAHRVAAAAQNFAPTTPAFTQAASWDSFYGDGSWSVQFFNAADEFVGDLELIGPSTATTIAGTYSVDLDNFCYVYFIRATGDTLRSDVDGEEFTVSFVSATDGVPTYHVSGDLTAGAEVLNLDFDFTVDIAFDYYSYAMGSFVTIDLEDAPFVPTGDTINIVVSGVSMLEDATTAEGWFEIYGGDDEYYVILDLMADQVLGTYGPADFDYDYTVVYDANDVKIAAVNDPANSAVVYQSADTIIAEAFFLAKDGNYYNVVLKHYIPTPTEEIDVTLDGTVDDETYADYGVIYYEIENDDYVLSLLLYYNGPGTYTLDDVVGMNSTSGSYLGDYNTMYIINIIDANFVIAADYSMTATLISTDARQFNISYNQAPTAIENVEAGAKAIKTIKNGHLVIEKNGVKFNAQGLKL